MTQPKKPDLPGWSDYLSRLGEQAKRDGQAPGASRERQQSQKVVEPSLRRTQSEQTESGATGNKRGPQLRHAKKAVEKSVATTRLKTDELHERGCPPVGNKKGLAQKGPATSSPVQSSPAQPALFKSWLASLARLNILAKLREKRDKPVQSASSGKTEEIADDNGEQFGRRITLGMWGFYFAVKLGMFLQELIGFHPLENLLFAVFILYPVHSRFWSRIKNGITAVVAVALLYYDSWLPPLTRAIEKSSSLSHFSSSYMFELLTRFINWQIIGLMVVAWFVYRFAASRLRVGVLVVASMLMVWLVQSQLADMLVSPLKSHEQIESAASMKPDLDGVLKAFFDKEAQRSVTFVTPPLDAAPFDIVFIHICSLSWDDVRAVGLEQHPLWKKFDFLFKKFNSAASYSGPAVIHLLRATCGQQKHENMYFAAPEKCYLMGSLEKSGFEPNLALNHNGKFDDFLGMAQRHGQLTVPPLSHDGLPVELESFYGAPLYDDLTVLNRWLQLRRESTSPRVALFYNTASLHDGNHLPGTDALPNTLESYQARLVKFLGELDQFMTSLEASGRRTVVVMVPEHGGAVLGDKKQIAGLREIPTPAITLIPVGIRVIGGNAKREGDTLSIDQPTSFLAISHILSRMLVNSPYANATFSPSYYVENLPLTQFVSQNEKMTVMENNGRYYLSDGTKPWEDYAEFNLPTGQR